MKQVSADPAPFYLTGGRVGLLLVHGFTGSASEFSLLAAYLHERGLSLSVPLLPGHGTSPADLNTKQWPDWIAHAEQAFVELQANCQTLFVGGQSMGALIALELSIRHPEIAGVIAYAPTIAVTDWRAHFVTILKYLTPTVAKPADHFIDPAAQEHFARYSVYPTAAAHEFLKLMQKTRADLPQVTAPILVVDAGGDTIATAGVGQAVLDRVNSAERRLVTLSHSGHVLTLDAEWQHAADATWEFIQGHSDLGVRDRFVEHFVEQNVEHEVI